VIRASLLIIVVLAVIAGAAAVAWQSVIPGLSSARREPPAIEVAVATALLRASVPPEDKARTNPLGGDPADIAAGQDIFRQKCEVCHAYDGSGRTQIGTGEYPRPPALHSLVASMRNLLPHTQRHPEHRLARLEHPGGADLAIGSLHPQSTNHRPDVAADFCKRPRPWGIFARTACHGRANRTGFRLALRGVGGMPIVPHQHL
jgi:cytochrome c5